MADRRSIWKREIHLRKRSEPSALGEAPAAAKPSIWKRELNLGGKKPPGEDAPSGAAEPDFDQPSLWESLPPDSPLAEPEDVSGTEQAPDLAGPDPGGSRAPGAPSAATSQSDSSPAGWRDLPTVGAPPAAAHYQASTANESEAETVPTAPVPTHTSEPEWAAEHEGAPLELEFDVGHDELEPETRGPYGWTDAHEEPWEVVASQISPPGWPAPGGTVEPSPPESTLPSSAGSDAAEWIVALTAEPTGRAELEPVTTRWWDSRTVEYDNTSGPAETDAAPESAVPEPEPVLAAAEPTHWFRAAADVGTVAAEPAARDREHALPPSLPAELAEPPVAVGWTHEEREEPENESDAAAPVDAAAPEWPTPQQAEPLPPVTGWEQSLTVREDDGSAEPHEPAPLATPVVRAKAPTPQGPKPSLLKRELRMPGSLRRPRKPSPAKAAEAHPIKNIVGLRIGSSQLAAAYVHNNGGAELVQVARTHLARGIVTGGEVRDPAALTAALKKFFAEHKLPRRGIRLGIASNRIGVRVLEVPALDDPRLFENSIRFHAQETLPISVSDAIIDHVVLGPGADDGLEPMARILLVFAHRELVDRHVQACQRAGLKLEGIDFEAFALLRALRPPRPAEITPTRAVVAVAIGQERTIFAVSDGRICDFTRVLEWGGGSLDVSIARALNLTPSQAGPLKLALSLDGDEAPSPLTPEQAQTARAAIRTELQSLSRELVASLQFYQARPGSLDIGEVMLSGGGAQLDGLAAELERLVGVPVVTGDPFARVEVGRKVDRPVEAGSLAIAIGLGIED